MLDGNSEESLFELFKGQTDSVIFVKLLILGKMPEYLGQLFRFDDKGVQLEDEVKVMPSLVYNFRVVLLFSNRQVTGFEQEVEERPNGALKLAINSSD